MKWLALLGALVLASPQETKKACDLKKIEDGSYCAKCKKVLFKTEKLDPFDKDGNCKECQSKPEKVKLCLKEWIPSCGMCQTSHEVCCCKSKQCCKVEVVRSVVTFRCEDCKTEARAEDQVQHTTKHPEKKPVLVCEKNGTFPHGGELPKKEK